MTLGDLDGLDEREGGNGVASTKRVISAADGVADTLKVGGREESGLSIRQIEC